jgi:peptidoglycan hydrolase CwlO-like protein
MDNIDKRLDIIQKEIDNVNIKLDLLLKLSEQTQNSCTKMDNHINFINNTYKTLQGPLDFITETFNNTKKLLHNK